jgi:hypothetical protein
MNLGYLVPKLSIFDAGSVDISSPTKYDQPLIMNLNSGVAGLKADEM